LETLSNTPGELFVLGQGTLIKLHLPTTRRVHVHNIVSQLAKTYSTGLRRGKRITWVDVRRNEVLEERPLSDPFRAPSENSKTIHFDIVIEYGDEHLPVSGRVYYDETTPASESNIQIGYGFRIIRSARECYQSPDGEEKYVGTGVSGWLDLGENWQPYLATTKDAFNDAPLFEVLMGHVFERIKPLLKEAEDKTFDVLFEDLNINLERALNGLGQIETEAAIKLHRVKPKPNPFPNPDPDSEPRPVLDMELIRPVPEPDGTNKTNGPALARTIIVPTNDVQMEGQLCRAQIEKAGDGVMILVNKDHHAVQEALKQKPINRLALLLMIVAEISEAICALDNSAAFIRKMFSRSVATSLNDLPPRDRARKMARLLIDRARGRGHPVAEAA
jgi:hypothetical protein